MQSFVSNTRIPDLDANNQHKLFIFATIPNRTPNEDYFFRSDRANGFQGLASPWGPKSPGAIRFRPESKEPGTAAR
jgi:hypothetical protein